MEFIAFFGAQLLWMNLFIALAIYWACAGWIRDLSQYAKLFCKEKVTTSL